MPLSAPRSIRDLPASPPPERYRRASDAAWEEARDDYLSGWTAPEVCERHGLGLSNLRARARDQGWRRADQPEPETPTFEEQAAADTGPLVPFRDQMDQARRDMTRALNAGKPLEAQRWLRLARDLRKEAELEEVEEAKLHQVHAESAATIPPTPQGEVAEPPEAAERVGGAIRDTGVAGTSPHPYPSPQGGGGKVHEVHAESEGAATPPSQDRGWIPVGRHGR